MSLNQARELWGLGNLNADNPEGLPEGENPLLPRPVYLGVEVEGVARRHYPFYMNVAVANRIVDIGVPATP